MLEVIMRINKQNKKTAIIIASIVVLILIGVGISLYSTASHLNESAKLQEETPGVNYDPPTEQEVEEGQDAKKRAYDDAKKSSSDDESTTSNKRSVNVGISFADIYGANLEVRAFSNGIVDAGTCTVRVAKGSDVITKKSDAFIDASSTQCMPVYIPVSDLSSGIWLVTVSFSSANAQGTSDTVEVKVP